MNIEDTIRNALVSTGRISPTDEIKIDETVVSGDYTRASLCAYHGLQKNPFVYWNICVDTVRELVIWDTATFYWL